MIVRPAILDDAEAIAAIYNAEVGSTSTFDLVSRTIEEQRSWIAEHSSAYPAVVALDDCGTVAGFGSLSRFKERAAYSTTVEDSVYVAREQRGRGTGKSLLDELLRLAVMHGFHAVMARISGGNDASVALHRACGFDLVGVERQVGRKFGVWLDVVVMERLL